MGNIKSRKEGKDQESIQPSITPDTTLITPSYHLLGTIEYGSTRAAAWILMTRPSDTTQLR